MFSETETLLECFFKLQTKADVLQMQLTIIIIMIIKLLLCKSKQRS